MAKNTRFVGLDVHADSISVAVAEAGRQGEVRSLGKIPNDRAAVRKLIAKLGEPERLKVSYEAGPCGYVLYWQLTELGVECEVVAPALLPVRPGDRVKTDRRDAEKLARCHRSGETTSVWVPDRAHEALRDLVRAREAAKKDQLRARHRLQKFLLRHGLRAPKGITPWRQKHLNWLETVHFEHPSAQVTFTDYLHEVQHAAERITRLEHYLDAAVETIPERLRAVVEALQALRGVGKIAALTLVTEVGQFSRFTKPRQLMAYSGAVPSEHSSGNDQRRGCITKTGNAHLRRVLLEAAWCYRHPPTLTRALREKRKNQSERVNEIALKAMHRLHARYWRLMSRGKPSGKSATAVARELLGFIWAIAVDVERQHIHAQAA